MTRVLEDKVAAADQLVSYLSDILVLLCHYVPDTIPTRIWHSVACVEAALWKYLSVPDPSLEDYLSVFALLKLVETRVSRFHPTVAPPAPAASGEPPSLPGITGLEPIVQRWIPKQVPPLEPTVYERYRLLISAVSKNDLPARFLVGVADAFVHASNADFRALIQALSRKRTELELPSPWPIPQYVQHDRLDPAWFMWGILMHLWPKRSQQWLMTKFKIYTWNYRGKTSKLTRLGILCCIEQRMAEVLAQFAPCEESLDFSVADLEMIEKTIEDGAAFVARQQTKTKSAPTEDDDPRELFYLNFIPRRVETTSSSGPRYTYGAEESKCIEI